MTGFGKAQGENEDITVRCEIKSLNGKFLELDIRLPKYLYALEMPLRNLLSPMLNRGSVVISFYIDKKAGEQHKSFEINTALAMEYATKFKLLEKEIGIQATDLFSEIAKLPDVFKWNELSVSENSEDLILQTAKLAALELLEFRKKEGLSMGIELQKSKAEIEALLANISIHEENRKIQLRTRLETLLADLTKADLTDANRMEQEILYFLDKWDIAEEKTRLKQHLSYFNDTLLIENSGKKLNFISQEMNREINTLGVKSNYFAMQQLVVEMKDKLEQIKELTMNVV